MIAVIFEVMPHADRRQDYLDAAAALRPHLEQVEGRRSIFADYQLRVAHVVRDYGLSDRRGGASAPP